LSDDLDNVPILPTSSQDSQSRTTTPIPQGNTGVTAKPPHAVTVTENAITDRNKRRRTEDASNAALNSCAKTMEMLACRPLAATTVVSTPILHQSQENIIKYYPTICQVQVCMGLHWNVIWNRGRSHITSSLGGWGVLGV